MLAWWSLAKPEVHNTGRQEGEVMSKLEPCEHRLKLVCSSRHSGRKIWGKERNWTARRLF